MTPPLKDHTIAVFGGTGFIGRAVCRRLSKEGATVRVIARHAESATERTPFSGDGRIRAKNADITDADAVAHAIAGADGVVNLVGILYEKGPRTFQALHADAARTVAEAAKAAGVKHLVHVSALGASADSASAYARTKAQGEAAARDAFPEALILRPSVVFGPGDGFFNLFADMAKISPVLPVVGAAPGRRGGHFRWLGNGGPAFQPVYVEDLARAVAAGFTDPSTAGKTIQAVGPDVLRFEDVMRLVLKATGRKRLLAPIPLPLAMLEAQVLQLLPRPPLTPDQVTLLKTDNIAEPGVDGLESLGMTPTAAMAVIGSYL